MKILQVTPSLYNGGGEIFAYQLSEALAKRGHSVKLISITEPDKRSPLTRKLQSASFDFLSLGKKAGAGLDLSIPFRLYSEAYSWKPDVVHTHLRALAYSVFVTRLKALKFHTVHSLAEKECSRTTAKLYKFLFARGWSPVAISEVVGKSIERLYLKRPSIVDNGVVRPVVSQGARARVREELGIHDGASVFIHIGRLIEVKNQMLLLDAFEVVASSNDGAHLVLVGNDPVAGEPYLRALKERVSRMTPGIKGRIHFLGVRGDVGDLLTSSDVFVLCSTHEGLPLTLLEAMSLGLKCVCTNVGGIPDALGSNCGWLIESQNVLQLVNALNDAITDKSNTKSSQAEDVYLERFSIEQCAKTYEELYEFSRK